MTPLDEAVEDYLASYRALHGHGDYFAVNVSSPNTPGLRSLQDRAHLDALLGALVGEKPVLVKIAPDLTEPAIAELLEVCLARGVAGVIATNTTLARDGLAPSTRARRAGRRPVRAAADRAGPGGGRLRAPGDRRPAAGHRRRRHAGPGRRGRMFDAGASLVQLYTGFIYRARPWSAPPRRPRPTVAPAASDAGASPVQLDTGSSTACLHSVPRGDTRPGASRGRAASAAEGAGADGVGP